MKKIIVALAVLFFASPALAQDYQAYGPFQPYQLNQLYQLDEPSQPDESFKFYQPYLFEKQQQPQASQPRPTKHSHRQINTDLPSQPAGKE
ncbi:MAG: hypothetical protein ABSF90_01975 [Syntrophobacteraceae bacterium]|jgi:hypothetical protein